ncbi:MAG: hypothetical protein Q8L54_09070 [Devosia sp.]|nr:hypothetical protein [Devosia sp.]
MIVQRPAGLRAILVIATILAMACGIYGGLVRIGMPLLPGGALAELHGPLMIAGVFGTLISLERAVAMGWRWPFLAPIGSGLGAIALLAGVPVELGALLFAASAAVLSFASLRILLLQPALFTAVLLAAALSGLIGNMLWLSGAAVPEVVGWWMAFLVCTIAAERLELSRVLRHGRLAAYLFVAAVALLFAGAGLGVTATPGRLLLGVSFVTITIWLARFDIATRTVRHSGQARFFAVAMLAGYFWLAVSGLLLAFASGATFAYDMTTHSVLIGFVLSMVFGHALIILPAVAGIRLTYHRALYLPLGLLHLSVIMRLAGGVTESDLLRIGSGIATAAALVTFGSLLAIVSGTKRAAVRP